MKRDQSYLHNYHSKDICKAINMSWSKDIKFYFRTVFVWFPDTKYMACPTCGGTNVTENGWPPHPGRRVVSTHSHYFIMTKRYVCPECNERSIQTKTKNRSGFMGWNSEVLKNMPFYIIQTFPAFLTHRAGVDKKLLDWFRPLVNCGVRPEQISRILLEMHTKEYTSKFIQYEQELSLAKQFSPSLDRKMFSSFSNPCEYDGKVPSGSYIETVYIQYGDSIKTYLDNEVKKRTGDVIEIDASYKIPKLLYQVDGKPLFKGLITCTNEFNEIRFQFQCPTDGHDQYVQPLLAYKETLRAYGQTGPRFCFVDNTVRDKNFLLCQLDTLKASEDKLKSCSRLIAPIQEGHKEVDYDTCLFRYIKKASDANEVCDLLMLTMSSLTKKVLSLDIEWGFSTKKFGTIQIGYYCEESDKCKSIVFHIAAMPMIAGDRLPKRLRELLTRTDIVFVGKQVAGDLKRVNTEFNINVQGFQRCIDLAQLAKTRGVIKDARLGLAALSEIILKKILPKPADIRLSDWDRTQDLTKEQQSYAAYDAIVSLEIFRALDKMPEQTREDKTTQEDIMLQNSNEDNHLPTDDHEVEEEKEQDEAVSQDDNEEDDDIILALSDEQIKLLAFAREQGLNYSHLLTNHDSRLGPIPASTTNRYSAVLGDVFHYMYRIKVPTKHEMKKPFHLALRQAFFVFDEDTLERVKRSLMIKDGKSAKEIELMFNYNPGFFLKCVPRTVPPSTQLYYRVRAVYEVFGGLIDSKSGKPLFNDKAFKCAKEILSEILQGFASDPPGFNAYSVQMDTNGNIKRNHLGYALLSCHRGTNSVEGVHKQLLATFHSWHTGVRMSKYMLAEFRHRYNHNASIVSRYQYPRIDHYDLWMIDIVKDLVRKNHGVNLYPGWKCTSHLSPTAERFTITSLQDHELTKAIEVAIGSKEIKLTKDQRFLANETGVRVPFLPFKNDDSLEDKTFAKMYLQCVEKKDEELAMIWASKKDGKDIFPKLPVHIRIKRGKLGRSLRIVEAHRRAEATMTALADMLKSGGVPFTNRKESEIEIGKNNQIKSHDLEKKESQKEIDREAGKESHESENIMLIHVAGIKMDQRPIDEYNSSDKKTKTRGQDKKIRGKRKCSLCKSESCKGSGGKNSV